MPKIDISSDYESISKAQSGDSKSFEEIIKSSRNLVEVIASKYANAPVESEDLVQEGMIGLFHAVESYDSTKGASFKTYANKCIDNAIQDAIKKNTRQKDVPPQNVVEYLDEELPMMNSEVSAEEIYMQKERLQQVHRAIEEKLSPLEKKVFSLYIAGFSYSEIAARIGKDEKAVDNAVQRIKKKLFDK